MNALAVSCPRCDAPAGESCRQPSGRRAPLHVSRAVAAESREPEAKPGIVGGLRRTLVPALALAMSADVAGPRKHRKARKPGPALRKHRAARRQKNRAARRARARNRR